MKILINENRVDSLINKWLEDEYGGLKHKVSVDYPDFYYFMKNGDVVMEYYEKYGRLGLDDSIITFIMKMFNKPWLETKEMVAVWFQNSYNLDVDIVIEPLSTTRTIWKSYSDN
jgi:hypothetical protein